MELRWLAGGGPAAVAAEANARHGKALWAARAAEEEEMLVQVLEENRQLRISEAELEERACEVQRQLHSEASAQEGRQAPQVLELRAEEALEVCCASLRPEASGHLGATMRSLAVRLSSQSDEMRNYQLHLEEASEGGSSSSTAPAQAEEELVAAMEEVEALRRGNAEWEAACASYAAAEHAALRRQAAVRAEEAAELAGDLRWRELEAEQAEIRVRLQEQAEGLEARLAEMNEEVSALSDSAFGECSEAELASHCEELGLDAGRLEAADFQLALRAYASRTRLSEAEAQESQSDLLSMVIASWSEEACETRAAGIEEEIQAHEARSCDEASEIHSCEMEVAQMNLQVLAATRYSERLREDAARAAEETEAEEAELEACEAALADEQRVQREFAAQNSAILEEVLRLRRQRAEDLPAVRALAEAEAELQRTRAGLEVAEERLEEERREEQATPVARGRRAADEEAEVQALGEEAASLRADAAEGQRQNEALQRALRDLEGKLELQVAADAEHRSKGESKAEALLLSFRNECALQRECRAALSTAADAGVKRGAAVAARLCGLAAEIAGARAERRELDAEVRAMDAEDREAEAKHRMDVASVTAALGLAEAQLEQFQSEAEAGQEALEHAERQGAEAGAAVESAAEAPGGAEAEAAAREELEELNSAIAKEVALLEEDRWRERAEEARAEAEAAAGAEGVPASLEACWRIVPALELSVAGQALPAEIETDAVSAMQELDPEALVGFLLACAAKPLCDGTLLAGLAAALRERAEHLDPLALASASRSLAVLSALDAATHGAIVRASSGEEFELVE